MSVLLSMFPESPRAFLPGAYRIKLVTEAWEQVGARGLREEVFCREQKVFEGSDVDAIDAHATTIVALSYNGGMLDEVAGTVRIHESSPGVWSGSRLAVRKPFRRAGVLGPALIRLAVTTAHARGARAFFAHVQNANVALFQRLHWRTLEEVSLHGLPHHLMQVDLAEYLPWVHGDLGWMATLQEVA